MRWMEIAIETTTEASDAICEMLERLGADGVCVCDPREFLTVLHAPDSLSYADDGFLDALGDAVVIRGYFAEISDRIRIGTGAGDIRVSDGPGRIYNPVTEELHTVRDALNLIRGSLEQVSRFLPIGKGLTDHRFLEDADWANQWKQYYDVMKVSRRVVICPTWKKYEQTGDEEVVRLDPGSAFGTGSHETTAMCILLLDECIGVGESVLDVGCGSGILSIVSRKLGADYVEAVDIDPLAIAVARENCEINSSEVCCHKGELKDAKREDYTLILANIIAEVISDIAPRVPDYLRPGGRFLVSGIIDSKKEKVLADCEKAGFLLEQSAAQSEWHAYLFKKI